jgi:hypothetical protein
MSPRGGTSESGLSRYADSYIVVSGEYQSVSRCLTECPNCRIQDISTPHFASLLPPWCFLAIIFLCWDASINNFIQFQLMAGRTTNCATWTTTLSFDKNQFSFCNLFLAKVKRIMELYWAMTPPGSKNTPSKKPAWNQVALWRQHGSPKHRLSFNRLPGV